jgi:DNA-directed RNA polymerase subunit alpha
MAVGQEKEDGCRKGEIFFMSSVKYGKFEMPESIQVEESDEGKFYAKFGISPFERGFGHTIGNALRRIMLTSLEAPAITSVRIEGVPHEFTAIDGVIEDMTHIVLNLKGALLRYLPESENALGREPKVLTKQVEITQEQINEAGGQYLIKLEDIIGPSNFEIMNPNHGVFTVTKPFNKRVDVTVSIGRGYVFAERLTPAEKTIDEIVLDTAFSPVKLVNYYVENTRVGQDTDYDKLLLEIKTDGRITPQEALSFAAQIAIQHMGVFEKIKVHDITVEKPKELGDKDRDELLSKLSLKISEIELSVRSTNCLSNANIETIGELVIMPQSEMLSFRNFGKKSLDEIQEKLKGWDLHLGMGDELEKKYGITRDNIKEVIDEYLEKQKETEE